MEANELMIGDWLLNKNIDKIMQVYPMMLSQMFRRTPDSTTEDYGFYPVRLSEELLLHNGFEKTIQTGMGYNTRDNYRLTFDVDVTYKGHTDTFTHEVKAQHHLFQDMWDIETTNGSRIYNLEYVHELQHALRLCGIDREITVSDNIIKGYKVL